MHYVDRGPEPLGLDQIRIRYTARWIEYHKLRTGTAPHDSQWTIFHGVLQTAFHGICGYCERICRGEVDHFRPKSLRPDLVYCWHNWIFSCHDCNSSKGAQWPSCGYVDPCANWGQSRSECYFTFDTHTGEILPKSGLDDDMHAKAQITIDDLDLNSHYHLRSRLALLILVKRIVPRNTGKSSADVQSCIDCLVSRRSPFSSLIRVWLSRQGYTVK